MTTKLSISLIIFSLFICNTGWNANPKIAVSGKQTVNFGTYQAHLKQKAVFIIMNRGDDDLIIKRIRKTCGCSATTLAKKILKPGEQTTLSVSIKKNSLEGPFSKAIYIESNSQQQRFFKLTLTGKAIPLLKIYPKKNLYMGTLKTGNSYDYSFKIEPTRKQIKLKVKVLKNNFPIQIKLQKKAEAFLLKVKVSPVLKNNFMNAEIEITILSPSDRAPIKIKLRGRCIK